MKILNTSHTRVKKLHKTNVSHEQRWHNNPEFGVKNSYRFAAILPIFGIHSPPLTLTYPCVCHTHLAYSCQRQISYFARESLSCWLKISGVDHGGLWSFEPDENMTEYGLRSDDWSISPAWVDQLPRPAPVTASCLPPVASSHARVPARDRDQHMSLAKMRKGNKVQWRVQKFGCSQPSSRFGHPHTTNFVGRYCQNVFVSQLVWLPFFWKRISCNGEYYQFWWCVIGSIGKCTSK